ncbi:MAG: hypothetical protein B7Z37_06900 [Verrucomicrobia bacterium 12-59-8]|nr:MAG: hypothetical protein B7Z37_06900 [Verrucomicrobia bacterium 12-59-8]
MKTSKLIIVGAVAVTAAASILLSSCGGKENAAAGISPQSMADALHAVMESDRIVYTKQVVNRLQNEEKIIKASEHWKDEKALPLPAQMFRMGAEMVAEKKKGFTYSLLSEWPINKQNAPKTEAEKTGLTHIVKNKGQNYYTEETLGGTKYFTAVYPDVAVAAACVKCHNGHEDSPRTDFVEGDVMGGVVIRIPLTAK